MSSIFIIFFKSKNFFTGEKIFFSIMRVA